MTLHVEVAGNASSFADAIVASIRDVTKLRGEVAFRAPGDAAQRRQGDRRRPQVRLTARDDVPGVALRTRSPCTANAGDGSAARVLAFPGAHQAARENEVTEAAADLLLPLRQETLRAIATTGVVRQFPKQSILINEGDVGDTLYIILTGRVKVYASNAAGREVVINFHGAGEYVGEMSLDGSPRSASVVTVEPTTCAVVNRAQFRDFIVANPDFAQHLIRTLIHRARSATENLKSLALSDVYGRLVRLLNALAVEADGKLAVRERLTQQDIADRVGASRDMVGQAAEGPRGGRLSARRGSPDHDRAQAAARLVTRGARRADAVNNPHARIGFGGVGPARTLLRCASRGAAIHALRSARPPHFARLPGSP